MTWEGHPYYRWSKSKNDIRYRVGCHELPIPREQWTKEDSYPAAWQWWLAKLATINAEAIVNHPHAERIKELQARLDFSKRHGETDVADILDAEIVKVHALPPAEPEPDGIPEHFTLGPFDPSKIVRATATEHMALMADDVWEDRFKRDKPTTANQTIRHHADEYVRARQEEAKLGVRSHRGADAIKLALAHFCEHAVDTSPVEAITYDLWQRWFVKCQAKIVQNDKNDSEGWAFESARKYFVTSRAFVSELAEREILVTPPKNLMSKKHKFERPAIEIEIFTKDEIRRILEAAKGIHRLIFLIMLNTGGTQKDVADLRIDEVDLDSGRIARRRSKTMKTKASRFVSYKLWPETIALLREHINTEGELALTTHSGQPWVWDDTVDGKFTKSDNVASIFSNLKAKIGLKGKNKSLRLFRRASPSALESNPIYRNVKQWFLGHKERELADERYAKKEQSQLDEAIDWLRTQFEIPN